MKKIISVILCAVMLLCMVPAAAFAENKDFTPTDVFTSSNQLESNNTYNIVSGLAMEVPAGFTLYVPANATLNVKSGASLEIKGNVVVLMDGQLNVEEGAVLTVSGALNIEAGGNFEVSGTVKGASKVTADKAANAKVNVVFPALSEYMLDGKVEVSYLSNPEAYADITQADGFKTVPDGGDSFAVDFNDYLYVKAHIIEAANDSGSPDAGRDKYDDALLKVTLNDIGIPYASGVYYTQIGTASTIGYSYWKNEDDFLTTKLISFPTGEGYEVIGRDGETAGDSGLKVKYGQPFSFRVEIDEAYDMSDVKVYVYNGYGWLKINPNQAADEELPGIPEDIKLLSGIPAAQPDADGYYTIKRVTGDITISVVGVVKNETINLIGNILDTIRNIFNLLKEFFESIFSGFKK